MSIKSIVLCSNEYELKYHRISTVNLSLMNKQNRLKSYQKKLVKLVEKTSLRKILVLTLVIILAVWTLRLVQVHYNGYFLGYAGLSDYHSDDTALANVLWQWQKGFRGGAVVGDDNWIIKFPMYFLTNNLPIQPIQRLFLNSLITLYITATIMVLAIYGFTKLLISNKNKQKLSLVLAGLTLALVGQEAFGIIKMPNSRNIELGIFMLLLLALLAYELRPNLYTKHKNIKLVGIMVIIGVLCANDPMFIYFGILPLAFLVLLRYFFINQKLITTIKLLTFMVVSLIITTIFKKLILTAFPLIFAQHSGKLESLTTVFNNLPELANSFMRILGIDVLSIAQTQSKLNLLISGLLFPIVLLAIWAVYYKVVRIEKFKGLITNSYLALLWVWIPVVYSFSTLSDAPVSTTRYIIPLVAILPFSIIVLVEVTNKQRQLFGLSFLIFVCLFLVVFQNIKLLKKHGHPNVNNFEIIHILNEEKLEKGYAGFWESGIDRFLSDQKINIIPVGCEKGDKLGKFNLFINQDVFNTSSNRTFFIYRSRGNSETLACSPEILVPQLGKPEKTIPILNGDVVIAIYGYDIKNKMIGF